MKCFKHAEIDAVGICRACNKGLCPDCATDLGHSIACKDSCEQMAEMIEDMLYRNSATMNTQRRVRYVFPALLTFMGVVMVSHAAARGFEFDRSSTLGIGLLIGGLLYSAYIRKWSQDIDRNSPH